MTLSREQVEQIRLRNDISPPAREDVRKLCDTALAALDQQRDIEIRNADGALDEVCAPNFHLEQMSATHWWMAIDGPRGSVHVNLHSRATIRATVEDEREDQQQPAHQAPASSQRVPETEATALLPCPFCGSASQAFVTPYTLPGRRSDITYRVECSLRECGCRTIEWYPLAAATATWNRRALAASQGKPQDVSPPNGESAASGFADISRAAQEKMATWPQERRDAVRLQGKLHYERCVPEETPAASLKRDAERYQAIFSEQNLFFLGRWRRVQCAIEGEGPWTEFYEKEQADSAIDAALQSDNPK